MNLRILACMWLTLTGAALGADEVTISVGAGTLFGQDTESVLPAGRLVLLVADTNSDGFQSFISGANLSANSYLNADDQILGRMFSDSDGTASETFAGLTLLSGGGPVLSAGDPLSLVWFTSITSVTTELQAGDRYGIFLGLEPKAGDAWLTPGEGGSILLSFLNESFGGEHADLESVANLSVSAIPEPSTYAALFGAGALCFAVYRRKRR